MANRCVSPAAASMFTVAGHFSPGNRPRRSRSLNRRMEIEIRNRQLQGSQVASTPEQGVSP